jgi:hypothetical protein
MLAQTMLRAVLGQRELYEMLSERNKLSGDVQAILDTHQIFLDTFDEPKVAYPVMSEERRTGRPGR